MSTTVICGIILLVILVIMIVYFCAVNKIPEYNICKQKGEFTLINQREWKVPPNIPLSSTTIVGIPVFKDDRYDCDKENLSLLYGGRKIQKNEAWVVKGNIPNNLTYWSFGLFKFSNGLLEEHTPIESPINNKMIPTSKQGDDIVCIVSPNYKLAEYLATQIKQTDYAKQDPNNKHVVFKYFPIPNYNANAYYNILFEAYIHEDSSRPIFEAFSYVYKQEGEESNFKFYPVPESKPPILINKKTIDEYEISGGLMFVNQGITKQIGNYKQKIECQETHTYNQDILYLDSGIIDLNNKHSISVAAVDHSSSGKCLYSELLLIDAKTGLVYENRLVGRFDPVNVELSCRVKIFNIPIPSCKNIRIIEKIVVDLSTHYRPDIKTIIPATVYIK